MKYYSISNNFINGSRYDHAEKYCNSEKYYNQGLEYFKQGNYKTALEYLNSIDSRFLVNSPYLDYYKQQSKIKIEEEIQKEAELNRERKEQAREAQLKREREEQAQKNQFKRELEEKVKEAHLKRERGEQAREAQRKREREEQAQKDQLKNSTFYSNSSSFGVAFLDILAKPPFLDIQQSKIKFEAELRKQRVLDIEAKFQSLILNTEKTQLSTNKSSIDSSKQRASELNREGLKMYNSGRSREDKEKYNLALKDYCKAQDLFSKNTFNARIRRNI